MFSKAPPAAAAVFLFQGIRIGGSKDSAEVNITMYLVEAETGQVKASTKVVGKSDRKGLSLGYHGSGLWRSDRRYGRFHEG
ncbi:MAG: CsgG/HfaB family protein [Desulfobacterales bacterium]